MLQKHSHHQEEMMEELFKKVGSAAFKKIVPGLIYIVLLLFPRAAHRLIPLVTKWVFCGKLPSLFFPINGELFFFGKDGNIFFDTRRVSLEEDPEKKNSFKTFFEQAINLPSYGENAHYLRYNPSWFWLNDTQYSVEKAGVRICIIISYNFRITNQALVNLVQTTEDLFAEPITFSGSKAANKAAHLRLPYAHFFTSITTLYGNTIRFKMHFKKRVDFGKVADVLERLEPNIDFEWNARIGEKCVVLEQIERQDHEMTCFMIDGKAFSGKCKLPQYPPRNDWRWCKRYKMPRCTLANDGKERFVCSIARLNHAYPTSEHKKSPPTATKHEQHQQHKLFMGYEAQAKACSIGLPHHRHFTQIQIHNGIPQEFTLQFQGSINYSATAEILEKIPWNEHCFWDVEPDEDHYAIRCTEKSISKLAPVAFTINNNVYAGAYGIPSFPPKEEWTYTRETNMWHTAIGNAEKEHLALEVAELCCCLPALLATDQPVEQQIETWRNCSDHVLVPQ